MSASMSHEANAEPNLVPILDMVFQLITFFMLVINFKAQSMDLNLQLPVLGSARPVKPGVGETDVLVLNVYPDGRLTVSGEPKPLESFIKDQARQSIAKHVGLTMQEGDALPTTIVLRADARTPFKVLNKVIKTCQDNGFRKFLLKAMNKKDA